MTQRGGRCPGLLEPRFGPLWISRSQWLVTNGLWFVGNEWIARTQTVCGLSQRRGLQSRFDVGDKEFQGPGGTISASQWIIGPAYFDLQGMSEVCFTCVCCSDMATAQSVLILNPRMSAGFHAFHRAHPIQRRLQVLRMACSRPPNFLLSN